MTNAQRIKNMISAERVAIQDANGRLDVSIEEVADATLALENAISSRDADLIAASVHRRTIALLRELLKGIGESDDE